MKPIFDLSNKTVLITGGAGLLGRQHATAIIEAGGTVIVADIDYKATEEFCKEINKNYDSPRAYPEFIDVLDKQSIVAIAAKYKIIDVLINNAAKDAKVEKREDLNTNGRFETMEYSFWKEDMAVGLDGCFLCSQVIANKMIENGGGNIINIASDLSLIAPDQRIYEKADMSPEEQYVKPATYSVSKWALRGLTIYMATYFAQRNIRVNCLSPTGVYNSAMPDEFVDKLSSLIPLGRMANIDEYKGAIVFLCSDASQYMTGANLVIDGGRSIW